VDGRRDPSPARTDAKSNPARRGRSALGILLAGALAASFGLGLSACGSGGGPAGASLGGHPAPPASEFPPASGKGLAQIASSANAQRSNLVVSPSGQLYTQGRNRFGFGVFTVSRGQVTDAEVAIYAAPAGGGKAVGPFPARVESLQVKPQFESQTTKTDPDSAKAVYVSDVNFPRDGNWNVIAVFHQGNAYSASLVPTIKVAPRPQIPSVGDRPPLIHTPTAADVKGRLSKIDTRSPPDDMHSADLADALGKRPIVLLFATPALCQSRVCGPVVDVAEEVKHEMGRGVDFIHMEVYNGNNASNGYRPQLLAFGLRTEPWLFVIDRKGIIRTRIEGAFSAAELANAVRQVAG
jgi:hypothetical protein